jgi:hypothetical protein
MFETTILPPFRMGTLKILKHQNQALVGPAWGVAGQLVTLRREQRLQGVYLAAENREGNARLGKMVL